MLSNSRYSLSRFSKIFLLVLLCMILVLFWLHNLYHSTIRPVVDHLNACRLGSCPDTSPKEASSEEISINLQPPEDYSHLHDDSAYCASHLGLVYLEELRESRATYCADPSFQVTCFHRQLKINDRIDSMCVGNAVQLDQAAGRFKIGCEPVEPRSIVLNESSLPMDKFNKYWYETGPRTIMDKFVTFEPHMQPLARSGDLGTNLILIKREGVWNPWHSLMEILSLSMSLDVLQMTPRDGPEGTDLAFLRPEDGENTQVVILDDNEDGPYFDLWRLFAKKPTIRLAELLPETAIRDIIIPLPGGSNPVWGGDWEPNNCGHSELLRTFSRRVLHHFDIAEETKAYQDTIVVTFIHRQGTRKLLDAEDHVAALQHRFTNSHVSIHLVDLAEVPFDEQIRIVQNSDVLAGVHGAGLTHGLWMRERSAMVEILPENFEHKGFRNLAGALGHTYFSTHGSGVGVGDSANWQGNDVQLERDRFIEVMDVAIKSMYNTGRFSFDISD